MKSHKLLQIWKFFRRMLTDSDLKKIASADSKYGEKENFLILQKIVNRGEIPTKLDWEPREALSLQRWNKYWKEGKKSQERAFFSSTVLLAASKSEESSPFLEGQVENVIIAIDCANMLGQDCIEILFEFFEYLVPILSMESIEEDILYFHLGWYLLALMSNQTNNYIKDVVYKTLEIEGELCGYLQLEPKKNILEYTFFDQRILIWEKYITQYGDILNLGRNKAEF